MSVPGLHKSTLKLFKNKVLPHDEVRRLIWRSQCGDREASNILVSHNMKFVYLIAKRYSYVMDIEDLMQEGLLGLLKAIADFDLTTNNKLSTYAKWWIVAYVKRAAQKSTGLTSVIPVKEGRHKIPIWARHLSSMGEEIPGTTITIGDSLQDENPLQDEVIHLQRIRKQVREAVVEAAKDSRDIAVARRIADRKDTDYGLGSISKRFDISKERVRQIEINVKKRLSQSGKLRKLAGAI